MKRALTKTIRMFCLAVINSHVFLFLVVAFLLLFCSAFKNIFKPFTCLDLSSVTVTEGSCVICTLGFLLVFLRFSLCHNCIFRYSGEFCVRICDCYIQM